LLAEAGVRDKCVECERYSILSQSINIFLF